MSENCPACNAPIKVGRLLCAKCGYALKPLVTVEDELRALEELGAYTRKVALKKSDDDDERRAAIGSLMASAFVPETLPAIKRAFLETVQNIQPSHLSDDDGNTLLRNRCEILLTKMRMDHASETRAIQELQGALDKRIAEWDADVATERRVLWIIAAPFGVMILLSILFAMYQAMFVPLVFQK